MKFLYVSIEIFLSIEGVFNPFMKERVSKIPVEVKLIACFLFLVLTGTANGEQIFLFGGIAGLVWILAGGSIAEAGHHLRRFSWFFFVMMAAPLIFYPGVPVLIFSNVELPISYEGVNASLLTGSKLATMFLISLAFMKTTSIEEIHRNLESWIVTLKLKDSIVEEGAKVFFLAWLIFPQLLVVLQTEFRTQKGEIDSSPKNPFKRAIEIGNQIIPLLANILKKPEDYIKGESKK
jgi:energy-coupling factor transporter transmembrane protein EcfT